MLFLEMKQFDQLIWDFFLNQEQGKGLSMILKCASFYYQSLLCHFHVFLLSSSIFIML